MERICTNRAVVTCGGLTSSIVRSGSRILRACQPLIGAMQQICIGAAKGTIDAFILAVNTPSAVYNMVVDHISAHIQGLVKPSKKSRSTERGELMLFFMDRLNAARVRDGLGKLTMPRMGRILEKIPTKDLYYLKSVCMQAKDFSKKFWWEIKPENHTPEAKEKAKKMWEAKKLAEKKQRYG